MVTKLKELIPRQLFEVPIQAVASGELFPEQTLKQCAKMSWQSVMVEISLARESFWKNKNAGKKRMKMVGNVEIPQEAFMAALKLEDE